MAFFRSILLLSVLLLPSLSWAEIFTGYVVSITYGDTITVLDQAKQQHKVRIAGIDAPERHQDFGEKSRASLGAMAFQRDAQLDCRKMDRYGRDVCVVFVQGLDIGLEQVARGMAWWYRQYAKEQTAKEREEYEAAEFRAKAGRLGLWSDKNPVPPWDWRRER